MRRCLTILAAIWGLSALTARASAQASETVNDAALPPAPDATQPPEDAPKPPEDAPKPPEDAPKPPEDPPAPVDDEIEAALAADAAGSGASTPETELEPAPGALGSVAASMNPDIALILDAALAYFSEDETLQTGGHDPTVTGFNLQQLELAVGAAVDPYFRLDGNLAFSQDGVEIEEAYGTTLALPARLQARFGQFLHRFGRINATHLHAWDFVDQPFALGRIFGGEGGRGLGVELSWLSPLPWYAELVATAQQADGEETARSFYGAESLDVESPADFLYVLGLKQFFPWSDDWSCAWGLSGALGPNPSGGENRTDVYGTDLYVKYRPITRESQQMVAWQTEVFYRRRQIPDELLQDVSLYSQLVVQLAQRWAVAGRYEFGSPAVGLGGEKGLDELDPEWVDERQRVALNLTFWPSEFSRLRLQGSYDVPGWLDRGIWASFLAVELVAGAHGAHAF